MASSPFVCSRCGQRITGNSKDFQKKTYCIHCYNEIISEQRKLEEEKKQLYDYIKELFGLSSCPIEIINSVDFAIKNGKKINGIRKTLEYYYKYMCHPASNVYLISKVIQSEYENAHAYFKKMLEIKKKNEEININIEPILVNIKPTKDIPRTINRNYTMEDLEKEGSE